MGTKGVKKRREPFSGQKCKKSIEIKTPLELGNFEKLFLISFTRKKKTQAFGTISLI